MATQLLLYNRALRILKERRLSSLTENQESRRLLDQVWDEGGVRYCLSQGSWNHAMRTVQVEYTADVEPPFGFIRAFVKPDDWVRTSAFCSDPYFRNPMTNAYADEQGYWFADIDTVYVKYVSDDASYGLDLTQWTEGFFRYAATYFAYEIQPSLTSSASAEKVTEEKLRKALSDAKAEDGQNEPTRTPPLGNWARARLGGVRTRAGREN